MVSISDIFARIVKQTELGEESPIEDTAESTPSSGPIAEEGAEPTVSSMQESGRASGHDGAIRSIRGWFDYIQARQEQFGELYPYTFDSTTNTIHLKRMSTRRKLYIFLLVSSNLENFTDDSAKTAFRNHFELVCKVALKEYLPKPTNVHMFGANPLNRGKYRGKTWERVSKLADDINETLKAREEDFSQYSTGDRGLDLVAWIPHKDSAGGKAIFFAQCGTGDNWEVKQNDTRHGGRWGRIIDCVEPPLNLMFIPICYRAPDGEWYNPTRVYSVLFDRFRLMLLLDKKPNEAKNVLPDALMERVISEKESLV